MPEEQESKPLVNVSVGNVNLGKFDKPADTLVKRFFGVIDKFCEPIHIRRNAKAKAEAAIIQAQSELAVTDIQRRAFSRFVAEETKKQINIEAIADKALPLLEETAKPEDIEEDWISKFFDKCRNVSAVEMQELWAKLLAGEANEPGTYTKRTINLLAEMEKYEAELFAVLLGFGWKIGVLSPLVLNPQAEIYDKNGMATTELRHLQSIGLITFAESGFYLLNAARPLFSLFYFKQHLNIKLPENHLSLTGVHLGCVRLTKAGQELATVSNPQPIAGFFDYVKERWAQYLAEDQTIIYRDPFTKEFRVNAVGTTYEVT